MTIKPLRVLLCCFVILCLSASSVAFASEATKEGAIRFVLSAKGVPVQKGSLNLYQIGRFSDSGSFQWNDDFKDAGVDYNDLETLEAAKLLADKAKTLKNQVWTVFADGSGEVLMEHVEPGLYLVTQGEEFDGFTQTIPFIVSVPSYKDGEAEYTATAVPKIGPQPVPPPEKPPELPKTGQLNWPIPLLFVGGLFLILLGALFIRRRPNET